MATLTLVRSAPATAAAAPAPAPAPNAAPAVAPASVQAIRAFRARPGAVAAWLFAVCALIALMVGVGGVTRLTQSGLSIVEWKPLAGTLPPLSDAAWAREFDAYRASSQYRLANAGMSMAAFQGIYWWEYAHRLLGRLIGLAFALPLAWFAARRAIPRGFAPRLVLLLVLGGAQGGVGWLMVASGLTPGRTSVEPRMLAAHLLAALTLFAAVLWTALDMRRLAAPAPAAAQSQTRVPVVWIVPLFALLAAQLVLGALTAGMHAGHASAEWPLMFGRLVPPLAGADWWEDPVTVMFAHRTLAWGMAAGALAAAWACARAGAGARAWAVTGAVLAQFALGVATVVTHVPIALAALHQLCAVALLASIVLLAHWARATRRG